MNNSRKGYSMIEMVFVVAILAVVIRITCPQIFQVSRRLALRAIAGRVRMVIQEVRGEAELVNRARAVKFSRVQNGWRYSVYEDGDGDGVRSDDIRSGVDTLVRGPLLLLDDAAGFHVGVPEAGVPHPDTGARITPADSPVNFNASTLCSFDPSGDGTPGTVYLTDGRETGAVRCSGDGGKISVLLYDLAEEKWLR